MTTNEFQELVCQEGQRHWRDMPWRADTRPYYVLVSEIMLQQTQVNRVIDKFQTFIATFPSEIELAEAELGAVVGCWQGLGYNRRAKYLHDACKMIVGQLGGQFPQAQAELSQLPGVGTHTAGAVAAYAFNQPALFIETNIRTVYIHHFFADHAVVNDSDILALLSRTIDPRNPRRFYQHLMDYGTALKRQGIQTHTKSAQYRRQPPLHGSVREVRGQIIATLVSHGEVTDQQLRQICGGDQRFEVALDGLVRDGLILRDTATVRLSS